MLFHRFPYLCFSQIQHTISQKMEKLCNVPLINRVFHISHTFFHKHGENPCSSPFSTFSPLPTSKNFSLSSPQDYREKTVFSLFHRPYYYY